MPAVLVHGVPDTEHVWHAVVPALGRADVTTLRLPGFGGAPVPAGFDATKDTYAAWLVDQIAAQPGPVAGDPCAGPEWGERLAKTTGAGLVVFPGCSHWWSLERPAQVAAEITAFWGGLR
jgi:pimeloyl-ACP methyl ester carboxylesterase